MTTLFNRINALKDYKPANRHFTSKEEMDYIAETLQFSTCSVFDLQNMRDMVVHMWNAKLYSEDSQIRWDVMTSLQSITAVIDHEMHSRA